MTKEAIKGVSALIISLALFGGCLVYIYFTLFNGEPHSFPQQATEQATTSADR